MSPFPHHTKPHREKIIKVSRQLYATNYSKIEGKIVRRSGLIKTEKLAIPIKRGKAFKNFQL